MEEQHQLDNFFNLSFDEAARSQLKRIALWAKICAIAAFAGYLASVAELIIHAVYPDYTAEAEGVSFHLALSGSPGLSAVVTIVIGSILNYFLYRFATAATQGVSRMDNIRLNEGLGSLRLYFKIFGILLLIVLVILTLAILISLLGGLTSQS